MAQYLHFYGLAKAPFCPGTDSEELYWSPSRHRLCSTLAQAITKRQGLIMLTGEEGVGKTTLLHAALESITTQTLKAIFVPAASHSFLEILRTLSWELAMSTRTKKTIPPFSSEPEPWRLKSSTQRREISTILRYLTTLVRDEDTPGRGLVLVLDDAHCYSVRTLRQLQQLISLQVKGRSLFQIVLVGQPDLERKINSLLLWRLRQQLALHVFLPPLTLNESLAYLCHRLAMGMAGEEPAFAPDTLTLLAGLGDGNPYRLNVLGHKALMRGYEAQQQPIPPESIAHLLKEVGNDLKKNVSVSHPLLPFFRMAGMGMVAGGLAVLSLVGSLSLWQGQAPTVVSSVDVGPAFASTPAEVIDQKVTLSDAPTPQPQVVMHEKIILPPPVVPHLLSSPDSQSTMMQVTPPAPSTTVQAATGSRSTDKMRPLQKQGKSVTTIPTKKPKGTSLAKVGNTTKVAKATVTTPPQKSAIVKRSSLSPKKLPPQRVVQQSQAKTLTQTTNYDRLFDE